MRTGVHETIGFKRTTLSDHGVRWRNVWETKSAPCRIRTCVELGNSGMGHIFVCGVLLVVEFREMKRGEQEVSIAPLICLQQTPLYLVLESWNFTVRHCTLYCKLYGLRCTLYALR